VRGKGTYVNQVPRTWETRGLTWIKYWLQSHCQIYLLFPKLGSKIFIGSFPLKIWSWPWYNLDFQPKDHLKVILNVKFRALSESGVKSRSLCGIAQRIRILWYRLYFKFVRCKRRTATLGRSEGRERWRAQALFFISIETIRIIISKWG